MRLSDAVASIKTGTRGYLSSKSRLAKTIARQERLIAAQRRLRETVERDKRYADAENAHLRRAFFNVRSELVALAELSIVPSNQRLRQAVARMDHDIQTRPHVAADPNAVSHMMAP